MTASVELASVWILASGISDAERARALELDPEFRRATTNVRYAATAVDAALAALPAGWSDSAGRVGLVVATGHGELDPTASFLLELGRSNVARPLLFQNSLHNTVAGFLALRHRWLGPVMTVSDGPFSGEDALDVAKTLLERDVDWAVVVGVDTFPPVLEELLPSLYPAGFRPVDRAAAVVLGNGFATSRLGGGPFPKLGVITRRFERRVGTIPPEGFFDAGALAVLAEAVQSSGGSGERVVERQLVDGSASSWTLQW